MAPEKEEVTISQSESAIQRRFSVSREENLYHVEPRRFIATDG
jgi:hypothetical protein